MLVRFKMGSVGPDTFSKGDKLKKKNLGWERWESNSTQRTKQAKGKAKKKKPMKSKRLEETQVSLWAGVWTHRKQQYNICQNWTGASCLHRRDPSVVWIISSSSSSSLFQRLCEAPVYFTAVCLWLQQLWPWDFAAPTICPSLRLESGGASPRRAPAMQQSWRMGGSGGVWEVQRVGEGRDGGRGGRRGQPREQGWNQVDERGREKNMLRLMLCHIVKDKKKKRKKINSWQKKQLLNNWSDVQFFLHFFIGNELIYILMSRYTHIDATFNAQLT